MAISETILQTMSSDYLGYTFGAVVAAGGAMGYVKKRSVPSLMAGLVFGGLAMAGAYHVRPWGVMTCNITDLQASVNPESPTVGAGVSGLLAGVMGARAAKSGKVWSIETLWQEGTDNLADHAGWSDCPAGSRDVWSIRNGGVSGLSQHNLSSENSHLNVYRVNKSHRNKKWFVIKELPICHPIPCLNEYCEY